MKILLKLKPVLLIFLMHHIVFAQSGVLDISFGKGGKVLNSIGNFGEMANSVGVQSDGKIIVAGYTRVAFYDFNFCLVRYLSNGNIDSTFGNKGIGSAFIEKGSQGMAMAMQSDEKIILGGNSSQFINVARFSKDGILDTSFGLKGKFIFDLPGYYNDLCKAVAVQNDKKIVVAGYGMHNGGDFATIFLLRLLENGSLDSSFGKNGLVIGTKGFCRAMQIQTNGRIVVAGEVSNHYLLARYLTNGTLDSSFGINGNVKTQLGGTSHGYALDIQKDGKILLGGNVVNGSLQEMCVARYHMNGKQDSSFGTNGSVFTTIGTSNNGGNAIKIQKDGKILLAGYSDGFSNLYNFALVQFDSNGQVFESFGSSGKFVLPLGTSHSACSSLAIQSDNKIILTGYSLEGTKTIMAMVRLNNAISAGNNTTASKRPTCQIFPNPIVSIARIKFSENPKHAKIILYDIYGKEQFNIENISEIDYFLNFQHLSNGIYFVRVYEDSDQILFRKLVVNKGN